MSGGITGKIVKLLPLAAESEVGPPNICPYSAKFEKWNGLSHRCWVTWGRLTLRDDFHKVALPVGQLQPFRHKEVIASPTFGVEVAEHGETPLCSESKIRLETNDKEQRRQECKGRAASQTSQHYASESRLLPHDQPRNDTERSGNVAKGQPISGSVDLPGTPVCQNPDCSRKPPCTQNNETG